MNKVTDRVVQYAHRYRLVNVETGEILGTFDLEQITGTIAVEGTKLNAELFNKMKTSIADVDLQEIFMMDNTYAFELDKPTVARAYADSDGNPINRTYLKTSGGVMSSGIQIKNNTTAPTGISYSVQDNIPMLVNTTLSASNQKLKFMGTQGGMLTFTMPSKAGTLALKSDITNLNISNSLENVYTASTDVSKVTLNLQPNNFYHIRLKVVSSTGFRFSDKTTTIYYSGYEANGFVNLNTYVSINPSNNEIKVTSTSENTYSIASIDKIVYAKL